MTPSSGADFIADGFRLFCALPKQRHSVSAMLMHDLSGDLFYGLAVFVLAHAEHNRRAFDPVPTRDAQACACGPNFAFIPRGDLLSGDTALLNPTMPTKAIPCCLGAPAMLLLVSCTPDACMERWFAWRNGTGPYSAVCPIDRMDKIEQRRPGR